YCSSFFVICIILLIILYILIIYGCNIIYFINKKNLKIFLRKTFDGKIVSFFISEVSFLEIVVFPLPGAPKNSIIIFYPPSNKTFNYISNFFFCYFKIVLSIYFFN